MTAGDIDFDAIFPSSEGENAERILFPIISYLLWIIFVIIMPVLFINMLVNILPMFYYEHVVDIWHWWNLHMGVLIDWACVSSGHIMFVYTHQLANITGWERRYLKWKPVFGATTLVRFHKHFGVVNFI